MKFTNKSEVVMDKSFPVESKFSEKKMFEVLEPSANSCSHNKGRIFFGKRQLQVLLFFKLFFVCFPPPKTQNTQGTSWDTSEGADGAGRSHCEAALHHLWKTNHILGCISTSVASRSRAAIFPNIPHWGDHIWTLSPVSGSPVRGRHWCTGVCPAEATEMVGGWRTWCMRLWKMSLFSEKATGGVSCYRLWPPHRRGQRRQRRCFSEMHNERPKCKGHKLEQGKFCFDIKP